MQVLLVPLLMLCFSGLDVLLRFDSQNASALSVED